MQEHLRALGGAGEDLERAGGLDTHKMTCRVMRTRGKCPSADRGCRVSQGDLAQVTEAQRQDLNSTECGMEARGHRHWTAVKAADAGGAESRWGWR